MNLRVSAFIWPKRIVIYLAWIVFCHWRASQAGYYRRKHGKYTVFHRYYEGAINKKQALWEVKTIYQDLHKYILSAHSFLLLFFRGPIFYKWKDDQSHIIQFRASAESAKTYIECARYSCLVNFTHRSFRVEKHSLSEAEVLVKRLFDQLEKITYQFNIIAWRIFQ